MGETNEGRVVAGSASSASSARSATLLDKKQQTLTLLGERGCAGVWVLGGEWGCLAENEAVPVCFALAEVSIDRSSLRIA